MVSGDNQVPSVPMVALPPPQSLSALCDDISSQTMKSLLKNRDSKDFVSLIHPKNLPLAGHWRRTEVDLAKGSTTAATWKGWPLLH